MRHASEKEYSVVLAILCAAIKERRCCGLYIPFANPAAQILCTASCSADARKRWQLAQPSLSSVSVRKRYNTRDFASKVVCHETAGFFGFFLPLKGAALLWVPPAKAAPPPLETTAKGTLSPLESQPVLKGVPTKEKWFVGIHCKTKKSPQLFLQQGEENCGDFQCRIHWNGRDFHASHIAAAVHFSEHSPVFRQNSIAHHPNSNHNHD